ncbi:hypothetical protein [Campylobacter concisus]|uniref:hypothetical protein n=1 Tax=Campylobacter concisus TaxID=199 RepID=UPI000D3CB548|nr:hypothetical protein [Campylobacter concisus]
MIAPEEIILYKNVPCSDELLEQIKTIATYTQNTWQQNRGLDVKIKDTIIGKVAEYTLKNYISNYSDFAILDYDDFRIDNYKKHAPLDCIIFNKQNRNLQVAIDAINTDAINNRNGTMSNDTKKFLKENNIFTMEIKSTRITDRHKKNGILDFQTILNDDFLAYPKFYRKIPNDIQVNSWDQYRNFCIGNNRIDSSVTLDKLKCIEFENMYDYYARVYVEQINNNSFDIYIIGHISKQNFIKNSVIKHMPQYNKSEQALYIATAINNGLNISLINIIK